MFDIIYSGFYQIVDFVKTIDPVYIYFLLFAVAFTENIIPPIPGDTFSIVGGYLAATGQLNLLLTFLAITLGCIASIMAVYYFGRVRGRDFFRRKNFRIFTVEDIDHVDQWFARYGVTVLLISRFIVGFRVAVAAAAGISRVPSGRMFVLSYISGAIFHGALIGLAYLLHAYVDHVREGFDIYSKIVLVAVAILIIMWFVFIFRRILNERKKS